MALSGNKGEWSEVYVLLKLLGDKTLRLGDENLEVVAELVYPIVKIIRQEGIVKSEFYYEKDVVLISSNNETLRIPVKDFLDMAQRLFIKIKASSGTSIFPDIEAFLETLNVHTLKASSADKTDITIQIHDIVTSMEPVLGFSIKSQLGRPSTLLNASSATNFTYTIKGLLDEGKIDQINSIGTFSEKFKLLNTYKLKLEFENVDSEIFEVNLQTIDTYFPQILSDVLIKYYSNSNSSENNVKHLLTKVVESNPLGYNLSFNHNIYEMKMKRFLTDYALGMRASKVWQGQYEANGGYLIVRNDGEVLCYHFYYKNKFEDYLLANTKLETASTSRHNFGKIYKEGSEYRLKLNLQIRFII